MEQTSIEKLMEIKKLYEAGILTKEEMEQEKQRVLRPISEPQIWYSKSQWDMYMENDTSDIKSRKSTVLKTETCSDYYKRKNSCVSKIFFWVFYIIMAILIIWVNVLIVYF